MSDPLPQVIPVRNDLPCYTMDVTLDGELYQLCFTWNTRASHWEMDIRDAALNEIQLGRPIVSFYPLNEGSVKRVEGAPPGVFIALDQTGNNREPDLDNFGTDVLLLYYPEA